jgi:hypothetical protein
MPQRPIACPAVGPFHTLCLIRKRFGSMSVTWCRGLRGEKTSCIDRLIVGDSPVKGTGRGFAPVTPWWFPKRMYERRRNAGSESKIWPKSVRCVNVCACFSLSYVDLPSLTFEYTVFKAPCPFQHPWACTIWAILAT